MRKLLFALLMLFSLTSMAAVNVKLQWDAKPTGDTRTSVRIYEHVGTAYNQVGEVTEPAVTITLTGVATGSHSYVARAWNGQSESGNSNEVTTVILATPGAPTTVTITIVVQ